MANLTITFRTFYNGMNIMDDFPQPFEEIHHHKEWLRWTCYIRLEQDTLSHEQYAWILSNLTGPIKQATFSTKHIGLVGLTEGEFTMIMRKA